MSDTATWKVGRLAEASGLTVRTLHHWDDIGLLRPSVRTPAGHREYTEDDLGRLYLVLALRRLGLESQALAELASPPVLGGGRPVGVVELIPGALGW